MTDGTDTRTDGSKGGATGWLTVPNVLCLVRLAASPMMVVLAGMGEPYACLTLALVLFFTDWLDGKLAVLLDQATTFGARLDSFTDAVFYGCLLTALVWLRWDVIGAELVWVGVALGSFAASVIAGLIKFGKVPSYHTRMAKLSWLVVAVAVVGLFADWPVWVLRLAMASVTVTNLEAIAITLILPGWAANVPSAYHATRIRARSRGGPT